jgi:hypothetical protein
MTDPSLALHLAQYAAHRRRPLGTTRPRNARGVAHDRPNEIDRIVRTLLSAAWVR